MMRALIVDDEEPARELLRSFLGRHEDVTVVGEAADGPAALALAQQLQPDIVFLDVQMPGMSGLDVVASLDAERMPLVVFVTAYDQYALRAFEVSACDYLLKPFDAERLGTTMRRVWARLGEPRAAAAAEIRQLLAELRRPDNRLVVKVDGRHVFIDADEIEWLESAGKDVRIHRHGSTLAVREPLNAIQQRLDAARFVRVHRSAIVNRAHIREMQPWFKGDFVLIMASGARIVSGRTHRAETRQLIGEAR